MAGSPPWTSGVLDSEGWIAKAAGLPESLARSLATPGGRPAVAGPVASLVVAAVGPEATAARIVAAAGGGEIAVPVVCTSEPVLPGFVGPATVVVALAGAPEPPEVARAADDALRRGAALVVVAPPGRLAALASSAGAPLHLLEPGASARGSLGAVVGALLVTFELAGVWPGARTGAVGLPRSLAARRDSLVSGDGGVARAVARRVGATFPVVHGAAGIGSEVARRWVEQVALAAKSPAFAGEEPARSASTIAGFGQHGDVTRQLLTLVELRSDEEGELAAQRFAATAAALDEVVAGIVEVRARGEGPLGRALDLALLGDFVALHLAAAAGLDPGPAPAVAAVARALSTGPGPTGPA